MRACSWIAVCMVAAAPVAAQAELFDPKAIRRCDGTTVAMSQCMIDEEEKARRLLEAVTKSFENYITYVSQQDYTEKEQVQELRAALDLVKKHGTFYADAMGSLSYWNDYPGTIRQLSTPAMRHALLVQQAKDMMTICTGEIPKNTSFDLDNTSWCAGQETTE